MNSYPEIVHLLKRHELLTGLRYSRPMGLIRVAQLHSWRFSRNTTNLFQSKTEPTVSRLNFSGTFLSMKTISGILLERVRSRRSSTWGTEVFIATHLNTLQSRCIRHKRTRYFTRLPNHRFLTSPRNPLSPHLDSSLKRRLCRRGLPRILMIDGRIFWNLYRKRRGRESCKTLWPCSKTLC